MLHTRHYIPEEVNSLLPLVNEKLIRMINLKRRIDELGIDIYRHQFFGGIGINGSGKYPSELSELIEILKYFDGQEILVKGIDNGLIDFPHIGNNGEEVYLCYLLGEDSVKYWHSTKEGFSGRKPLSDLQ